MTAAPPMEPAETYRGKTIEFAEPGFDNQDHAGNDNEDVHRPDAESDDDTLAARGEARTEDSKDGSLSSRERIRSTPKAAAKKLHLKDAAFGGPSRHMNPTSAKLDIQQGGEPRRQDEATNGEVPPSSGDLNKDFQIMWRSRDNRKGSMAVPVSPRGGSLTMRMAFASKDIGQGIWRLFSTFPYWDMSFWSGFTYSVGSALFVIDGFWSWLPLAAPSTEFHGESKYGAPLAFFFGALFYQTGAVMAYLEAINDGSFAGSAMKRLLLGHDREAKEILDEKLSKFFHQSQHGHHGKTGETEARENQENQVDPEAGWRTLNRRQRPGSIYPGGKRPAPRRGGLDLGEPEEGETVEYYQWRWFPTWHRFRTHHIYEIGYLSCTIQLFGVTLYGVTSIVILPGILDSLSEWQENAAYWIPQIVASTCFLVASFGFTWETQVKWYKPEFHVLGWWIGFWCIVGSVGFSLCAIFGIQAYTSTGNEYQSSLSTTWGSFAYLAGSTLQWYEAVNKHSVQDFLDSTAEANAPQLQPVGAAQSERHEPKQETQVDQVQQAQSRQLAHEPEKVEHKLQ